MGLKTCTQCHQAKPRSEFYQVANGLYPRCKECHRAWARRYKETYRAAHPYVPASGGPRFLHSPLSRVAYALWGNAVRRSAHRDLPQCDLTREWVEAAVTAFCAANYHVLAPRHPFRPSLDRIDKNQGYTTGNVRVVWLIENLARNGFTDEQVLEFCRRKLGLE